MSQDELAVRLDVSASPELFECCSVHARRARVCLSACGECDMQCQAESHVAAGRGNTVSGKGRAGGYIILIPENSSSPSTPITPSPSTGLGYRGSCEELSGTGGERETGERQKVTTD